IAQAIDGYAVHALERQRDGLGIGAGGDHEVVFELPLVTVVDEVDARIEVLIPDLCVRGNVDTPLLRIIADEVVAFARQLTDPDLHLQGPTPAPRKAVLLHFAILSFRSRALRLRALKSAESSREIGERVCSVPEIHSNFDELKQSRSSSEGLSRKLVQRPPQRASARRPSQNFGRDPAPDELPVARVAGEPAVLDNDPAAEDR